MAGYLYLCDWHAYIVFTCSFLDRGFECLRFLNEQQKGLQENSASVNVVKPFPIAYKKLTSVVMVIM